jgi:hypothetical protein
MKIILLFAFILVSVATMSYSSTSYWLRRQPVRASKRAELMMAEAWYQESCHHAPSQLTGRRG